MKRLKTLSLVPRFFRKVSTPIFRKNGMLSTPQPKAPVLLPLASKSWSRFLVVVSTAGLSIACQPEQTSTLPVQSIKPIVYCSEGSPDSFNPQLVTSGTAYDASANTIFNRLVEYKAGTTELEPALAQSWSISEDGLRYRFTLKNHVSFHANSLFTPTRFMNADDVVFSFQRQKNTEHPYHNVSGGNYPYFESQGLQELIREVVKVDNSTVEFVLSHPESPFLSLLATPFASIMSKEYADHLLNIKQPEAIDTRPIGTGPFSLSRYEPNSTIRFKAFEQHFRYAMQRSDNTTQSDILPDLVYAITPDPAMRFARFSAGECDVMSYPLPVHLRIAQSNNLPQQQVAGLNVAYWAFNVEKPPLNQEKVRRALALAVDKEAILTTVYDNQATLASGPIPPTSWAYKASDDNRLTSQEERIQTAKKLLQEADIATPLTIDIWAMPIQRVYNPNARKMAEMIQQDLKKIGVTVNIISYEWGTFLSLVKRGAHQSVLLGWNADNSDPSNFFGPLLSCKSVLTGNNYAKWCDNTFDDILTQARQSAETHERIALYNKAQTIFAQRSPWLAIAHANKNVLNQPYVKNLVLSPMGNINFAGVRIDETESKGTK